MTEDPLNLVRDPYSAADHALGRRILAALERIADALEAQNAADPLTMLDAALKEADDEVPADLLMGRQAPIANNGFTVLYRHPIDPALQIVARRNLHAEGGYSVGVEKA